MNKYEGFVGKVLDSRYKILELVGMGGMACVLKAQDLVMNRIVAIKILNDEYNGDEQAEARFLDESKAVAMLSNKNIVSVYDVAIYPDIKYIVMEFLDGITLREYLDNKHAIGWKEACIYILQILRALEHAHSKGIIHRDIKPQNVMLMKNGEIKVTDFGIAKLPKSVATEKASEKAVGTVYYISPEQACGKETDYYSDIYSTGIMLYEAVTGTLPFVADTPMEVAMMQVNDEPVNPRDIVLDIPVGVSQIILKALEKAPEDRFASAHSMAKAIEWVLRNPDVIFSMTAMGAEESPVGNTSVVSIDMIDTAEIEPYKDDEIADTLGKKSVNRDGAASKGKNKDKSEKKKKEKTNRSMFPIILGVALAFLLVAIALAFVFGIQVLDQFLHPDEGKEYVYPELTGKIYSDSLRNELLSGSYGAKFYIDDEGIIIQNDPNVENNKIIATEPAGGHISKVGNDGLLHFDSITINRSEKVVIPYLTGCVKNEAQTKLINLGLKVDVIESSTTDGNAYFNNGQILSTSPEAGSEVKVGDTVVVYYYSRPASANTAKMHNCVGFTKAQAQSFAGYCKYACSFIEQEVEGGNYTVISQSIPAGKVSPVGTEVVFTIGIPISARVMPNLEGLTLDEAKEAMYNAAPDFIVYLSAHYVTGSEDMKTVLDTEVDLEKSYMEMGFEANINELINSLTANGFRQIFADEDGSALIVFQGVGEGKEFASGDTIDVLLVKLTPSESGESEPTEESEETVVIDG